MPIRSFNAIRVAGLWPNRAFQSCKKRLSVGMFKWLSMPSIAWEKQWTSTTFGKTTFTVLMAAPLTEAPSLIAAQRLLFCTLYCCARTVMISRAKSSPFRDFTISCKRTRRCFISQSAVINLTTIASASPSHVVPSYMTETLWPDISPLIISSSSLVVSWSTIPSGEAPRIPEEWNQIPVSLTVFPVFKVKALIASSSLLTPHCTAFTLERSYSPRRRFRSEGVTRLAFRTLPKLLAVRRPLLAKCQAGLSRWPTVTLLIFNISSSSILDRQTKQSSCWSPLVWRNSSENIISSIVGIGSSLKAGGSGLSSQQRPVNLPYCLRSLYSCALSTCTGFLPKAVYFLGGGNISATAWAESDVFDFLFLHWHSTSVLLRLWMPCIKSAAAWLHLNAPLGHSHSVDLISCCSSK